MTRAGWVGIVVVAMSLMACPSPADETDREVDRAAIRKATASFVAAFEKGDADQVRAHLTEGAELVPDEHPPICGREEIGAACAKHFASHPNQKITLEPESLRFTSRDTAVEEGLMRTAVENEAPASQQYKLLHVREDGNWLLAEIQEWPSEGTALRDLDWLIGSWEAKGGAAEVQTTYEWLGDKAFIRGNVTVRQKDRTLSGMQVIGTDPDTGELSVWVFEAGGGVARGTCSRDGKTWVFETEGLTADGGTLAATNILARVNNDKLTWQPINLIVDDRVIGNLPPISVTRVREPSAK
jgi:uncharacterized protein (TIGR02246 family)